MNVQTLSSSASPVAPASYPLRRRAWCGVGFLVAVIAVLCGMVLPLRAAPGDLQWVRTSLSSGNGSADTRAMWVDGNDNLFAVGRFVGTVDLFGTTLTATSETVPSGFVAKFSPDGTPQWVRKIGTDTFTELYAVEGFPNGEILVGGTASGTFASGAVGFAIPGTSGRNALLVRLDANGNAVWGYHGGTASNDTIDSMASPPDGQIAIGGNFVTSITLGATTLPTYGSQDGFIARVAADGTITEGRKFGGTSADILFSIAVDHRNLTLVSMNLLGNANIGMPAPVVGPSNNFFIAQYMEGASAPIWYRLYTGSSSVRPSKALAITARDDVLTGGNYAGSLNLGGASNLPVPSGVSGFLFKLDRDIQFQWQKQIGDGPVAIGDRVIHNVASKSGVVGVVGIMRSASAMIDEIQLATSSIQSPYFAMLEPNGHCLWAKKIVNTSLGYGSHVQTYSNSDFVFGGFTSPADFGNGITTPSGTANHEAYVARYQGFPYPEIAVEQAGGGLNSYGTAQDFGNGFTGIPGTTKIFTIRNDGSENLTGITPTLGGTNPGDFILDASATATTLAPGATTTFSVRFSPTALGARSASVSIASNDYDEYPFVIPLTGTGVPSAVSVAVAPESAAEDGAANLAYTFNRTGPTSEPFTVNFAVSGSASFGTDYTQSGATAFSTSTGSVTFPSGSVTAVVTLDPTADAGFEADKTAILTLSPGAGYEIGSPAAATGTILNDDTEVTLAVPPASMAEDAAGTLDFTFTRAGPVAAPLTVGFTVGGTAGFGSDYTQSGAVSFTVSTGTATFAAGAGTATVSIDPTTDPAVELNETVILTTAPGSGYQVGASAAASGMILNDDTVVPVQFPASSSVPLTLNGFNATGHTVSTATLGFQPTTGMILTLVSNTSANPIAGAFENLPDGGFLSATFGGRNYVMIADYSGGDGNDITLTVVPSGGTGVNPLSFTMLPPGRVALGFQGTPDEEYQVQRSTILSDWTVIAILVTDSTGALGFIDEFPPPGRAFYRVARVSNFWGNGSDGSLTTTGNLSFASAQDGDVVVKQFSNLTINAGHTVTTSNRCRGLVIYVDGDCTINGTLSMTARGANVNPTLTDSIPATGIRLARYKYGSNQTLAASDLGGTGLGGVGAAWRTAEAGQLGISGNGTIYTIAREGGAGGAARFVPDGGSALGALTGGTAANGTGGGASGGSAHGLSGAGSAGTCYSGGSGGGGANGPASIVAGSGAPFGGSGGIGAYHASIGTGGGAGNPGGAGYSPGGAGGTGTGGLLVLLVKGNLIIGSTGSIRSEGAPGGYHYSAAAGGGSGGGRVLVLHAGNLTQTGTLSANGQLGSGGAPGGNGAITIDHINP